MIQTNLQLLKPYEFELNKPQFNHFSKFIQCLQVCDKPTINRFYHLHNTDRSSMNRFLTESPWKLEDLENIHLNQISKYYKEGSSMLIDDTISHRKYAKKVEGANYHFNHTESKQSLGYCILTSTISFDNQILPYIIKPYYRKDDCVNTTFKSKNEMAKEIILSSKNQEKIKYVIFDTWFSNDIVINACKSAGKNYITQIKSNRNITIDNKKRFVREHAREIKDEEWFEFAVEGNKLRIVNTSAFISKIGSIHLIFSQMYDEKKSKWGETHFVISNLIETEPQEIILNYLKRVGIEGFHREAKQNTGLEGYHLRKRRGIERYLFLTMIAYSHLVLQGIIMEQSRTIGELTEVGKKHVFMDSFDQIQRNPELKEVICMKLAKARV